MTYKDALHKYAAWWDPTTWLQDDKPKQQDTGGWQDFSSIPSKPLDGYNAGSSTSSHMNDIRNQALSAPSSTTVQQASSTQPKAYRPTAMERAKAIINRTEEARKFGEQEDARELERRTNMGVWNLQDNAQSKGMSRQQARQYANAREAQVRDYYRRKMYVDRYGRTPEEDAQMKAQQEAQQQRVREAGLGNALRQQIENYLARMRQIDAKPRQQPQVASAPAAPVQAPPQAPAQTAPRMTPPQPPTYSQAVRTRPQRYTYNRSGGPGYDVRSMTL